MVVQKEYENSYWNFEYREHVYCCRTKLRHTFQKFKLTSKYLTSNNEVFIDVENSLRKEIKEFIQRKLLVKR